jgi:hypothetical protein
MRVFLYLFKKYIHAHLSSGISDVRYHVGAMELFQDNRSCQNYAGRMKPLVLPESKAAAAL